LAAAIASTKRRQAANSSARSGLAASGSAMPTSGASRGQQRLRGRPQLAGHLSGVVGLQEAGVGLDDLPQRPERDAVAVGQAAALPPDDQLGPGVHERSQLADEAGLADPRLADDRDQPHGPLGHGALEQPPQQVQFLLAAHERGVGAPGRLDAGPAPGPDQPPHGHRVGLAPDLDRGERLVVEQPAGRPEGRLPDHHAAHRRHPLQARGGVDDVADHALGVLVRPERHQRLPGGDADAHRQVEGRMGAVQLVDGGQHAEGAAHRPLRVVAVGDRRPEHGHDRVADELVQRAAQPLDLGAEPRVVGTQQGADVLGVGLVGAGGEPDQVAEQHRHQAALRPGVGRAGEGSAAGPAEPEALGVVLPAGCAAWHRRH
jgi:hypothetical protein